MGDGRTYEYVVALRAVQTEDFMTAHWAELPYGLLSKVSNRIINEVRGINRVVYDISGQTARDDRVGVGGLSRTIAVYRDLLRSPSRQLISAMAQSPEFKAMSGGCDLH